MADDLLKNWDQLNDDEKKLFIRQADVFAAYWAYSDHEIGRVIQQIEKMGKLDNTLIIYIAGDNGNSAEGTLVGTPNEVASLNGVEIPVDEQMKFYDAWGSDQTYPHMAVPWTWAFDTPFSWTKQIASHFGGVRQGMAISWPKVIKDKGGIRNQFHHVIDIVPTILEATGIKAPDVVDGIQQKPIEGVSMMYTFDAKNANAPSRHTTQYFEMMGDHAIYHDGWIASTKVMRHAVGSGGRGEPGSGELPVRAVRSQQGLDAVRERRRQIPGQGQGDGQAVLDRGGEISGAAARRQRRDPGRGSRAPASAAGRTDFSWSGEITGTPNGDAPSILDASFNYKAEVDIPQGGAEGMIVTQGGRFGGYGFYLLKGKPVFLYNFFDLQAYALGGHQRCCRPASTRSSSTSNMTVSAWARSPSTM